MILELSVETLQTSGTTVADDTFFVDMINDRIETLMEIYIYVSETQSFYRRPLMA
jgi:ribosome assembly protein YihI (activator of Der GTPase)